MRKRFFTTALAVALVPALVACSTDSSSTSSSSDDSSSTTTAAEVGAADDADADAETDASDEADAADSDDGAAASSDAITLTVWGAEEDQALLQELVAGFEAQYSDYTFDISIGVESESTAKDTVLADIEAAADVFAFADDQLNDLVNAGALASLDTYDEMLQSYAGKSIADIESANGEGSVTAATKDDTLYAFPMGGGNNFFLYYDSSVISEEDAASWDTLLAAAEAAGGKVGMTLASGWYNAGFFLGAGFTSSLEDDGVTTYIDWNGTSSLGYTGVEVVEAMLEIASNSAFMAVADGDLSNAIASGDLVAVVDGTWDASAVEEAFGDGYAATKLPTYTIGDDQVQQYCYSGFKLMGVNAYSDNIGWAVLLAEYLTNEESQVARFNERQLAPTNLNAAADEAVTSNIAIAASAAQDVYGVVQSVGGNFWDPTASLGASIAQGTVSIGDTDAIQALLDEMVEGVTAVVASE